jgi:anti-anti-sigma regulatory factor
MNYKIVSQNHISIVTIDGELSRGDKEILINCTNEIKDSDTGFVVINFKNVPLVDPQLHRELTMLQHEIRKNGKTLKVVGLNLQLKTMLVSKGVIRSNELGPSLKDLLSSFQKE